MSKYIALSERFTKGTAYTATLHSDRFGFKPKRVKLFTLYLRFSHAITGAISAELRGEDGVSGALGAVTGEIIGEAVGSNLIQDGDFTDRDKDVVRFTTQLGTIGIASVFDKDIESALNSSRIAVDNNIVTVFSRAVVGGVGNHLFGVVSDREDGKPDVIFSLGDNGSFLNISEQGTL